MSKLHFRGPPLSEGMLPAIYYFALSAEDSLDLDPYNQPVNLLANTRVRVFSKTLPCHGPHLDKKQAMSYWAEELSKNHNIVAEIVNETQKEIEDLVRQKIIDPEKIGAMGLSRGGFIAAHLAARETRIQSVLGFAPLVSFQPLKEFHSHLDYPLVHSLALEHIAESLIHKKLRFYIGNRDERVSTHSCFCFITHLADTAWHKGIRSPTAELMIIPSIGHKGHGTSYETFQDGINWIKKSLNLF